MVRNLQAKQTNIVLFLGVMICCNLTPISGCMAQNVHALLDSLLAKPPEKPGTGVGFVANWDARSSFIKEKRVNVWGVNAGIVFGQKRDQVTLGYYWMDFNSYSRLIDLRKNASKRINLDYYTKTDLYFFSIMYWKNFIDNKSWRISVPFEVGIGATNNKGTHLLTEIEVWKRKDFFMPVQAGVFAKWKATRWIGLAVQGGYRYSLIDKNIHESYDGFYYSFGLEFQSEMFTDLYRWAFKKNKVKEP